MHAFCSKERTIGMTKSTPVSKRLIFLSLLLCAAAACVPQNTPPAAQPTPTLAPGWETYSHQGQCVYAINHPSDLDITSQGPYSSIFGYATSEAGGSVPNFLYVSVIPDGFPSGGDEIIYNYDPAETNTLLNLQVGESISLRADPNLAPWFTYTRLSDASLSNQSAQTYENTQPWEFPPGTKEIRYYLQGNGCTYLVGGYISTVGSGQAGAIDQELFEQIIATFRLPF
jgi:hypothetical protein